MGRISVDQFCAGFAAGDAISNEALLIQEYLRRSGYTSEIYSENFAEKDAGRIRHFRTYRGSSDSILIYHYSFFTRMLRMLPGLPCKKLMVFHNVTPGKYVRPYNRRLADSLDQAREALEELRPCFSSVLADSRYNAGELRKMGYSDVEVKPVLFSRPRPAESSAMLPYLQEGKKNIIFVGRVFPNKMHQDLIKSFYFFKKIYPEARLICVGSFHPGVRAYTAEIRNLVTELDLNQDVVFTGMVSDAEVAACYRAAHLFFSMSDHEGFCVPLAECMYLDIPVVARAAAAVPETLGTGGILIKGNDYPAIAETMAMVLESEEIQENIRIGQKEEIQRLQPQRGLAVVQKELQSLGLHLPEAP
ncbi:MAG: glycosyltransferase [Leptospiraceae bacterium]|nr:glycosyltransferase [Leptospiraceae bacterium]MCB1303961.1 glycosyltransferase [Leptospiraceae bacterium]